MKRIMVSLLFLSSSLFSCDRTPPSDPSQLEAWIEQVVKPKNRHRGIKIDSLAPEIQKKISERATDRLAQYLEKKNYNNGGVKESEKSTCFFDNVQFLVNLHADTVQFPHVLTRAHDLGIFYSLGKEFENFALQMIEDRKCSTVAIIQFLSTACLIQKHSRVVAQACINKHLLAQFKHLSLAEKNDLIALIDIHTSRFTYGASPELFNILKEKLYAQVTS